MAVEFPAFLKLEYRSDNSAGSTMLADLDRALSNAEGRFREFSSEAKRQLDQALSISRNDVGSLDLNVPQMRAAAEAQQARRGIWEQSGSQQNPAAWRRLNPR